MQLAMPEALYWHATQTEFVIEIVITNYELLIFWNLLLIAVCKIRSLEKSPASL
jgi:hypothetical protein